MLNPKIDLFEKDWINTVFEGRNKSYGAYNLRVENPKTTIKALLIGGLIFVLLVSIPVISRLISENIGSKDQEEIVTKVELTDIKLPEPVAPEPIVEEPIVQKETKSIVEVVKNVPPVVVNKREVAEEMKTVDELKDKVSGSKDVKASDDGVVVLDGTQSTITNNAKLIEEDPNKIYTAVEVKPEYPGGIAAFYKFVQKNFRTPEVDQDVNGRVIVNFVVEKDGSLTDIKVVRDLGFGTGKEAIRLLKSAPKWKPGIQNGNPVRVLYSLPIMVNIKS